MALTTGPAAAADPPLVPDALPACFPPPACPPPPAPQPPRATKKSKQAQQAKHRLNPMIVSYIRVTGCAYPRPFPVIKGLYARAVRSDLAPESGHVLRGRKS